MYSRIIRSAYSIIVSLVPLLATHAQQTKDPIEVVITESARLPAPLHETPSAVQVINRPLNNRQGLGLDEALLTAPGVYAQNRYNAAQDLRIAIRGFGSRANFGVRGVKIMVDGVPHTMPDGQAQLDSIDLTNIDRIEIRRGPSSALYGNASGGVVDIRTTFSKDPGLSAETTFGDYGFNSYRLRATGGYKDWGGSASVARVNLDGYRAHSSSESDSANVQMRWTAVGGEWTLLLNTLDAPNALDPGGLTKQEAETDPRQASARNVLFNAGESVDQQKAAVTFQQEFSPGHTLLLRAYGFDREFSNRLPFQDGGAVTLVRSVIGTGIQWRGQLDTGLFHHTYTLGMDVDDQDDDRQRFDNLQGMTGAEVFAQNERVRSVGLFLQNMIDAGDSVTIQLGARLDTVRFKVSDAFLADGDDSGQRDFDHLSPMFGVSWKVHDTIRLYSNIATSFETPTTTELANPNGGGFNPDLRPQTATNYEVGTKIKFRDVAASLAVFHIRGKDELIPFELQQSPGRSFFRNAGSSIRDGLEASLEWRFHAMWSAIFAYTYSDFVFDRFSTADGVYDGNRIPGIPRHLVAGQLRFRHPSGWFANTDLRYVGDLFADDANLVKVDSYWTAGLQAGIERELSHWKLKIFGGINNASNERYFDNVRINAAAQRFFEPAAERNAYAGVILMRSFR